MDGLAVNITIMSYRGTLYWGIISCPETMPGVWQLAADIPLALDELLAAAGLTPAEYRSSQAADAAAAAGLTTRPPAEARAGDHGSGPTA